MLFWFRIAAITIFGNVCWSLKMFSNVITNLSTTPQFSLIFLLFSCYFTIKKAHISLFGNRPWTLKMFPNIITNSEKHPLAIARLNILVFGLFICICLHKLSFQNNSTNKVYILQKRLCHLDQNWPSYVEIFILAKLTCWIFWSSDYLFVFVYIYCHIRIILQKRCTYCKKDHVIWTRIGGAM